MESARRGQRSCLSRVRLLLFDCPLRGRSIPSLAAVPALSTMSRRRLSRVRCPLRGRSIPSRAAEPALSTMSDSWSAVMYHPPVDTTYFPHDQWIPTPSPNEKRNLLAIEETRSTSAFPIFGQMADVNISLSSSRTLLSFFGCARRLEFHRTLKHLL